MIKIIFVIILLSLSGFSSVFAGNNLVIKKEITETNLNIKINAYEKHNIPINKNTQYDSYDLLMIHPKGWGYLLDSFIDHKEKHGIKTIAIGIDEIYNDVYFNVQGRDQPEQIKYFIKNAVENWNISYVLLIGGISDLNDQCLIPVRYVWLNDRSSSWEYERSYISDLYYADIYDANGNFSSWDSNHNNYFGEYDHEINDVKYSDHVDLSPDVYIGRLPVRNKLELKRVLTNIIFYENNPSQNSNNVVLCGGDLYLEDPWNVSEGEYILDDIAEQMTGFTIKKIYASNGLDDKIINTAINEGAGFVIFEGAGNPYLWGTHAKDDAKWIYYRKINILQLKNDYLPIVLASGARTGGFNNTKECFDWFFVSTGKAVASIGSTGLCWIGHGTNVTTMFLGNLHVRLCSKMSEKGFLGGAWGEAIREYLADFSWTGFAKAFHMKAAEELELFGDPTLKIGGYSKNNVEQPTMSSTSSTNIERIFSKDDTKTDFKLHIDDTSESSNCLLLQTGNTIHVGGNGNGNYSTIQNAIDNAHDGDHIIVHPGTYYENLIVDKQVQIIGKDATIKTHHILLISSFITLEGFRIEGYNKTNGISCIGNNITIHNNTINRFNTSLFISGDNCSIYDNAITDNYYGIYLNKNKQTDIYHNVFHNDWCGIWGENSYSISISNNNFTYSEWYAIWMEGKTGEIKENMFDHNWYSIYLYNAPNFYVHNNTIIHNIHGTQFVNSSNNIFCYNNVQNNQHYGIYFGWRSKNNTIFTNNFINNYHNVQDDGYNNWDNNYYSDYIGLKINILSFLDVPYKINKKLYDRNPANTPYDIP